MANPDLRRLHDDVASLCNQALDLPTFFDRARESIAKTVPHDGCCWMTFDPATLLPTTHIPYHSIPPEQVPRLAQNEYAEEDVNKFAFLWQQKPTTGVLSEATHGDKSSSTRYRVLLRPNGFENEMRASFGTDGACWGGVAFYRSERLHDFAPDEALALAEICELMADGIRRAVLTQAVAIVDPAEGPGFILVDGDGKVDAMNSTAQGWLDDLLVDSQGEVELPSTVHALVGRTRLAARAREGIEPAQARARTRSGRWVVMHGSVVDGDSGGRIAVIIEEARAPQVASLIAAAYGLTPRERELSGLVIQGYSTREIAERLFLSPHTVQDHLKSIFDKVGVRTRRELVTRVFSEQYAPRMGEGVPVGPDGWFVE